MAKKRKIQNPNPNSNPQNSNDSAETVASIVDTLIQILIKVPIKPLIRFKLVNKHWLSLITSHEFCLLRNPIPNPASGIFLCQKSRNRFRFNYIPLYPNSFVPPPINLSFAICRNGSQIIHSCNGLLLCCSSKLCDDDVDCLPSEPDCLFYVFNPTTNISTALPELPYKPIYADDWWRKAATLVFDPVISPHYKIVFVLFMDSTRYIRIYSSETGSWIDGGEVGFSWHRHVYFSGVYCNGYVHWIDRELSVGDNGNSSVRFHVESRTIHEMPSPPVVRDQERRSNYYFGESCGHLHFVEPILPRFNVYEMKMDYSEWFVKYKVDLSLFVAEYPEAMIVGDYINQNCDLIYVLSLIRGENDKDSNLVLRIRRKAVKFNLVDGTFEKLCDLVRDKISCAISFTNGGSEESSRFVKEYGLDYFQSLYGC